MYIQNEQRWDRPMHVDFQASMDTLGQRWTDGTSTGMEEVARDSV